MPVGGYASAVLPRLLARPASRSLRALVGGLVLVAVMVWWVGRGNGQPVGAGPGAPAAQSAAVLPPEAADIGKIAAVAGCRAQLTVHNSDYQQAGCVTRDERLTITTFRTDQNQHDWLADALPYGGAYLVGARWVVSANARDGLVPLAARLGGTILDQTQHRHS